MNLKILIDLSYISTFDKLRESVAMYAVRVISEWNNIGMVHFCVLVHENMKDIIVEKFQIFQWKYILLIIVLFQNTLFERHISDCEMA